MKSHWLKVTVIENGVNNCDLQLLQPKSDRQDGRGHPPNYSTLMVLNFQSCVPDWQMGQETLEVLSNLESL